MQTLPQNSTTKEKLTQPKRNRRYDYNERGRNVALNYMVCGRSFQTNVSLQATERVWKKTKN
jgi:hypothetical protein